MRRWTAAWQNLLNTWNALDDVEVIDSSRDALRPVASKRGTDVQIGASYRTGQRNSPSWQASERGKNMRAFSG